MITNTYLSPFAKVQAANSTATSFSAHAPTATSPIGTTGVIENPGHNLMLLMPFGTDAANETFNMRVTGIRGDSANLGAVTNWYYCPISEDAVTLGAATGTASMLVLDTELYADTIVSTYGASGKHVLSPADDTQAHIIVDVEGFPLVLVEFDMVLAAGANALWALL